ncbi:DUF1648 domain-containing protein [Sphaerisporangium sp. NBC_01403]|uniref:DUF1648 domain-containing protein n=1 Tax=Sphaerisporangium sp. NBC_01403 TaxID=2903599 RepID=UPI00324B300E
MSHRPRFLLVAGAWVAAVTGALVAVPLVLRDRLPEPLATHWGLSGEPNGAMSFWTALLTQVGTWALIAAVASFSLLRRDAVLHRARRRAAGALLGGGGGFVAALQGMTLAANLDRPGWHAAGRLDWQVLLAVGAAVAGGALGWLAASPGPDEPYAREPVEQPRMRLRPGQRVVWMSSASNPGAVALGVAGLVGALVLALSSLTVGVGGLRFTAGSLAVIGVIGLAVSTVRVRVSDQGVVISFGPFRWPSRKLALRSIQSARAEERHPLQVGGWGLRGLPGSATIMVRGGECLVVRYPSGGELGITVDDAAHGAALLNALIAERSDAA